MQEDRIKWNQKFRDKSEDPGRPHRLLVQHHSHLKPGTLIDIAGGDGRHGVYFAGMGFDVTVLDISNVGLQRAHAFAEKRGFTIQTIEHDLDEPDFDQQYDNAIISFFKPGEKLIERLPDVVTPGGTLVICTFNEEHGRRNDFPQEYCLSKNEFRDRWSNMDLVEHLSWTDEDDGECLDFYLFKRH